MFSAAILFLPLPFLIVNLHTSIIRIACTCCRVCFLWSHLIFHTPLLTLRLCFCCCSVSGMNTKLFAVLLVVAGAAAVLSSPTAGDFSELLVLDCNNVAHVFPSQPFLHTTVDATLAKQVMQYFQTAFQSRVKCRCPSLTTAQVDQYFASDMVGTMLQWAEPKSGAAKSYAGACNTPATNFNFDALSLGDSWDSPLPGSAYFPFSRALSSLLLTPGFVV